MGLNGEGCVWQQLGSTLESGVAPMSASTLYARASTAAMPSSRPYPAHPAFAVHRRTAHEFSSTDSAAGAVRPLRSKAHQMSLHEAG